MRQVLMTSSGAIVARMPRPGIDPGTVLVRVRYSLISTGTELAALKGTGSSATAADVPARTQVALTYLGKAIRNPSLAARRVTSIARRVVRNALERPPEPAVAVLDLSQIRWERAGCLEFDSSNGVRLVSDTSAFGYQAMSQPIEVMDGKVPIIEIEGEVLEGNLGIGLLDASRSAWLGSRTYSRGAFEDRLIFDPKGSGRITVVIANAGDVASAKIHLRRVSVLMAPPTDRDLPQSELDAQGWNVGYSAVGEIVDIGAGVSDLAVGDLVACAGAGRANHADYVAVPRNLVCKLPRGCDMKAAATTTVGSIALQGVRRAAPALGETVAVLGLGLIGQITAQMLRANGCRVLGMELDAARVARARESGIDAAASTVDEFNRLVRDLTGGRGVDRVLITAATKSDSVINLAMEAVRAKGVVVIVGDVGLNVARDKFYRKEVDLLMSTSYGPGRYDNAYELEGRDYPFAYVRWTLNRNMAAYLDLVAAGHVRIDRLIDRVVPIASAPEAYKELATSTTAPLAVLLEYPDDTRDLPEPADAPRISIRGFRKPPNGVIRYALVGAGAFGTSMLVPAMARRKDRFFLRGIVSRSTVTASNFARANQVEILATELDAVLDDPDIDLVVIATRHHEHADQALRALAAGKHVFVEKPLALSWDELDRIATWHRGRASPPLLMVGFNRRYSPAMQALGEALAGRRGPLVVNYRLNGGYIPLDSWVQGEQGGGRNIGEACHMYDLFRCLAGAPVNSISASAIDPGRLPYLRNDNFTATCTYGDGTLATLTYVALGPKSGLPKERVEVYCDGEAYVLDDYRSLTRASDGVALWQSDTVDKGHHEELSRFGDAIAAGGGAPISFDDLMETSAVALHVEDLLGGRQTAEET